MWQLAGETFQSRLILGTSRYPSPEILKNTIESSEAEIVTVSLRRQNSGEAFWSIIKSSGVKILPNTAGCRTTKEALTIARLAREVFGTAWIKLEVIGEEYSLMPDPFQLVEAAEQLIREGFEVFPYTTSDAVVAERLINVGCKILMPLASPIGTGKGVTDSSAFQTLRNRFPDVTLICDAGIGKPSHASQVMELGFEGVLLNTAVATAVDPVKMGRAFCLAIRAGCEGYRAGLMAPREIAEPSTPILGTPFGREVHA
jgi:thiazole synthase